jgi:hypothetical protein
MARGVLRSFRPDAKLALGLAEFRRPGLLWMIVI